MTNDSHLLGPVSYMPFNSEENTEEAKRLVFLHRSFELFPLLSHLFGQICHGSWTKKKNALRRPKISMNSGLRMSEGQTLTVEHHSNGRISERSTGISFSQILVI